jgi:hypothetical protein
VSSGSPAVFVLRQVASRRPRTVGGALALARRGMTLLRAKRAMEELLDTGRSFVDLPMVEDATVLPPTWRRSALPPHKSSRHGRSTCARCATGSASAANHSPPGSAWRWRSCGTRAYDWGLMRSYGSFATFMASARA